MIDRLHVKGFKNLVDTEVYFGKFNVILGENGVGKSNLFDAIQLLSALVQGSLTDAIRTVRGGERGSRQLFSAGLAIHRCRVEWEGSPQWLEGARSLRCVVDMTGNAHGEVRGFEESVVVVDSPEGPILTGKFSPADEAYRRYSFSWNDLYAQGFASYQNELINWKVYDIDPAAVRQEDGLLSSDRLGQDGSHLPAMLLRLKALYKKTHDVFLLLSNRLYELTGVITDIRVRRSESREAIWIEVREPGSVWHTARVLSDGTLRFLALVALALDPEAQGVFCIEEPENGIHPSRLPALIRLLRTIAEKPGCQVIVNTHSPALAMQVPDDCLLYADLRPGKSEEGFRYSNLTFFALSGTWRVTEKGMLAARPGDLLPYLNPVRRADEANDGTRVADRDDLQWLIPGGTPLKSQ